MDCPSTCGASPSGAAATLFLTAITSLSNLQCNIGDPKIYPQDTTTPDDTYDFIVIGGGTAGCVVANRLSSNPGWKVLLIEAGGDPPFTSEVPALSNSLQNTDADWSYLSDGEGKYCLGMVNHKCRWPQGKTVGGSSVINAMRYVRGNPEDYNRWAREGNPEWSYEHLENTFDIAEGIKKEAGEVGSLNLEEFLGDNAELLQPIGNAAREIGNQVQFSSEKLARLGYFNVFGTVSSGTRSSVAKSFLAPIADRKNLHVLKNTLVLRILFDHHHKRAIGVECEKNGELLRIHTRKEIIVSSGVFAAPQLLMNSGIGPREHLAHLGIKLVANLPVGEYMNGHIQIPAVVASINRGSSQPQDSTNDITNTVDYLISRLGPLSGIGYGQFVGFIDSTHANKSMLPDNQITFSYFKQGDDSTLTTTLSTLGYGHEIVSSFLKLLNEADLLVVTPSIQHPKSYGRVRLVSGNPRDRPKITPNYFSNAYDERAMFGGILEGIKLLRTCSLKSAARVEPRVLLPQCLPRGSSPGWPSGTTNIDDTHLMTKAYWRCVVRKMAAPDFLPVGTCKMGPSARDSVVDSKLRVHSVKGLRVIDAAVMPHITTGDTQGAVVTLALKGARMVKSEWGH